ncbi:MAG: efflux RND transporter periplasmic adaptor subunit [Lysobacterales bacterium CG02_land_8_20_14_3_00_62_12]|nr:MAG: efflux RND transporter periplasmic adaptor subunit [Xanthomonadales bacterium CG02_land_8_20_14_3_00_62_12]
MDNHQDLLKQLRIERQANASRKRPRWLLPLVLAVAGVAAWMVVGSHRAVEVETTLARSVADSGPVSLLDASGFVTARRVATVSSKVTGKVREVLIEEGQSVQEGDILATLDDTDAKAAMGLSQAQKNAAKALLAELRVNLDLADRELVRQTDLVGKRLASQQSLDTARAAVAALHARIASQQSQIEVATRSIGVTQQQLDNTVVRAPFTGVITVKAAQPGEMISPISAGGGSIRTGIGTLVDMDSLEIQVDVNEAYIGRVQANMPVVAVLNAYQDWKIPGRVLAIVPAADRTKATVKVRIALEAKDNRIVPDMGVRVSFLETPVAGAPKPSGAWVAASAVTTDNGKSVVFVVDHDRARKVAVEVGDKRDADQLIKLGLRGGETVVVAPPAGFGDGQKVRLKVAATR